MIIDAFTHIVPAKYLEALRKKCPNFSPTSKLIIDAYPSLTDLDTRFRIMDCYEGLVQVLSMAPPSVENISSPEVAVELAQIANDEMAELVRKYPDKFVSAVACLPMNDIDAALKEIDRAISDLRFRGIQLSTDINGKPLDSPEFMPIYDKMAYYDLPILLHPQIGTKVSVHANEKEPKYLVPTIFIWPLLTTVAMTYLVGGGVFEKHPNLKVLTHHCGAMVPFFAGRIGMINDNSEMRTGFRYDQNLTKRIPDYFRSFYADTAIQGSTPALMCGYDFFGAEHILFGTDLPFDSQIGEGSIRQTILSVEGMDIPDSDKKKIYEDNARKLFRLPV